MRVLRNCILGGSVAFAAAACSGGGGGGGDEAPSIDGVWQRTAGTFLEDGFVPDYLELLAGGTGTVYARQEASGIELCPAILHAFSGDVLTASLDGLDTRLYRVERPDADTLELVTAAGESVTFTRADAVPETARCFAPTAMTLTTALVPAPHQFGTLAFDGTDLWYTTKTDRVVQMDPATLTTTGGFALTNYRFVNALQGSDIWANCGCGSLESLARKTAADAQLDLVSTQELLGEFGVRINGAVWTGSRLFLATYHYGSASNGLLEVDSDAEPDVLVNAVELEMNVQGLAVTGDGSLWTITYALDRTLLVRMDPASGMALDSMTLPYHVPAYWHGVAVGPGVIWISGDLGGTEGALLTVEVPL